MVAVLARLTRPTDNDDQPHTSAGTSIKYNQPDFSQPGASRSPGATWAVGWNSRGMGFQETEVNETAEGTPETAEVHAASVGAGIRAFSG